MIRCVKTEKRFLKRFGFYACAVFERKTADIKRTHRESQNRVIERYIILYALLSKL